ncbi:MAG TPA: hypothetical protein VKS20_12080 [Candidatus Acidoferrales bacterium]|nr:hypothetical protein [Candidatus Acidoferrales bacterium]
MRPFFLNLWLTVYVLLAVVPVVCRAQTPQPPKPNAKLSPQPAIPAILAAFDKYEVVAMSEAHGDKDLDDFILSLIRSPEFPEEVNDIAVECGNSLYQPILDRYIAGEKVPFTEVQKVWRNTTQPMCGISEFFEEFFPLVRAINQKLPPSRRLRVLAGDPPIDWDRVKNIQDYLKYKNRDASIASVMEKQVLSKHQKALMLFGEFHDLHGINVSSGEAVTMYEKDYPNVTFVIDDLSENFNLPESVEKRLASWRVPSLALARGTWLGAMQLGQFDPLPFRLDPNCHPVYDFPRNKPMAELADAFLYLGPTNLALKEPMPADVALDKTYMKKWLWRTSLLTPPFETLNQADQQIVNGAGSPPLLMGDVTPEAMKSITQAVVRGCLEHKKDGKAPR